MEKIALAFLNSFENFAQSMISFVQHQREVNQILVEKALKKLKSDFFNIYF